MAGKLLTYRLCLLQDSDVFSTATALLWRVSQLVSKMDSQSNAKAIPPHRTKTTPKNDHWGYYILCFGTVSLENSGTLYLQPTIKDPKDDREDRYLHV